VHSVIDQALQLIKRGEPAAACTLLTPLTTAPSPDASALRLHAAALAQLGNFPEALRIIEIAMRNTLPEPATRALAARIFEDAQRWNEAFEQYAWLAHTQTSQVAFLRGAWRVARAASQQGFEQRALLLTRELDVDISTDTTLAWVVTAAMLKQPPTETTIREINSICERTFAQTNRDPSARWLRVKRAVECAPEQALALMQDITVDMPASADDVNVMLALPQQFTQAEQISAWRRRYQTGLRTLAQLPHVSADWLQSTAFYLSYHGRDDTELQRLRGDLLQKMMSPILGAVIASASVRTTVDRQFPRIAFVSKHIRDCTVGHYFQRLITDLNPPDQKQFEVWVYVCNKPDALTEVIAARVDSLQVIALTPNADNDVATSQSIAARIAHDQIDVLIYPEIGMEPLIEKLAAMRLAPTQCALWGHPVTTGLPSIDIFFSAALMEPDGAEKHYREQLQRLPGLGTNYPQPPVPERNDRAELGLPMGMPLVACTQSSFKWSPDFMRAVAEIFSKQPTAKLLYFINREPASAYVFERTLRSAFAERNINFDQRTHRVAEMSRTRFLSMLAHCDLALDTFGFSGGNTSLDALSVGLPVLTLPGEFMRGRQTMAMLQTINVTELIAADHNDYVARAVQLIEQVADTTMSALREKIMHNTHRLFNDPAPIIALREHLKKLTRSTS
jgi:hypothetical protein